MIRIFKRWFFFWCSDSNEIERKNIPQMSSEKNKFRNIYVITIYFHIFVFMIVFKFILHSCWRFLRLFQFCCCCIETNLWNEIHIDKWVDTSEMTFLKWFPNGKSTICILHVCQETNIKSYAHWNNKSQPFRRVNIQIPFLNK